MKTTKRTLFRMLAIVLCLATLFTVLGVSALAAEEGTPAEGAESAESEARDIPPVADLNVSVTYADGRVTVVSSWVQTAPANIEEIREKVVVQKRGFLFIWSDYARIDFHTAEGATGTTHSVEAASGTYRATVTLEVRTTGQEYITLEATGYAG